MQTKLSYDSLLQMNNILKMEYSAHELKRSITMLPVKVKSSHPDMMMYLGRKMHTLALSKLLVFYTSLNSDAEHQYE